MPPETPPETYFQEIEAHFALRRGTPFILNAKDWALMKKWYADGVPLPVVIEAIDAVFEKNETSGRKKVISSLSYCRHSIKELWQDRQNLYVGGGDVSPEAGPEALLDALAAQLETSNIAAPFAPRVRALASFFSKTVSMASITIGSGTPSSYHFFISAQSFALRMNGVLRRSAKCASIS